MNFNFKELVEKELNINLSEKQLEQFTKYHAILCEWNEKMNLTGITEINEVNLKHFFDSLTLSKVVELENKSLCDVGSGAGFPAIPLKIAFPTLEIVMVDSLNKRINFLNEVINQLGLEGIKAVHSRAEEFTEANRESFDIVTARAVARLNILIELCSGLVKKGGSFVAMKANSGQEELDEAKNAIKTLGFNLENTTEFILPIEGSTRFMIKCKKVGTTNKMYPRPFGKIKNKPL